MNSSFLSSTKFAVLLILCLQNTIYTVLRRYSQGYLYEEYSKYEVLLAAELLKFIFSLFKVSDSLQPEQHMLPRVRELMRSSSKMFFLALMYGAMNILSFVALRNLDAGTFTIFAQLKILTTATFSTILLDRKYTNTRWRALIELVLGALLFSSHIFSENYTSKSDGIYPLLGVVAVITEVTASGFASIYFEKVIKNSQDNLNIWERNLQLAFTSTPIYLSFILYNGGGDIGYGRGWSITTVFLSILGAAGGMLVALSIKYADAVMKTLATTGAIVLSSILDHFVLDGPLNPVMLLAGGVVILAICNYTFDQTSESPSIQKNLIGSLTKPLTQEEYNAGDKSTVSIYNRL